MQRSKRGEKEERKEEQNGWRGAGGNTEGAAHLRLGVPVAGRVGIPKGSAPEVGRPSGRAGGDG